MWNFNSEPAFDWLQSKIVSSAYIWNSEETPILKTVLELILSSNYFNSVHYFLTTHFNILHSSTFYLRRVIFPSYFTIKIFRSFFVSYVPYISLPFNSIWFDHLNHIWWRTQIMTLVNLSIISSLSSAQILSLTLFPHTLVTFNLPLS
jgi:hypothetical protein